MTELSVLAGKLHRPLAVFDSGVGGLTVLRELRKKLPGRDFLYLADTARVPYGRKPKAMIAGFAAGIFDFLLQFDITGIVIACNTASAAALPEIAENCPVPVWGVIDPGVEAARRRTLSRSVGVIGTAGTIRSGAYQSRMEACGMRVWAQACPMFVHLVEEGMVRSEEAQLLARQYLCRRPEIDTLILGCTHYPVLRDVIQREVGFSVQLVSSDVVTAEVVSSALPASPEQRQNGCGRVIHMVTGDPVAYEHTAQVITPLDGEIVSVPVSQLNSAREMK